MKRKDGKKGFGEIFKGYGDALDIMAQEQKELSVWKGETTELIQPLTKVDIVGLQKTVGSLNNDVRKLTSLCERVTLEYGQMKKEYLGVRKDYCLIKEENEKLKEDLAHLQELTDVISLTCSKECADLKNMAKKKVMVMLGGNTTDERYKLFYKKYIMNLYSYIKKELGVSSIDKIPTVKLEEAKRLLAKWQPTLSFKKKLITDLVKETTPTKNGAFKTKVETVVQFNSLMEKYNGEPEKYI